MAKQASADPYLDSLNSQLKEKEAAIAAAVPKKLLDEKLELEIAIKLRKAYNKAQNSK